MSEELFTGFEPVTIEQWRNKIENDLKLDDVNELRSNLEGIVIEPAYKRESVQIQSQPFKKNSNWSIVQEILVMDAKEANKTALSALERGASSLLFYLLPGIDLNTLFKDIKTELIQIHLVSEGKGKEILNQILSMNGYKSIRGSINVDCLENLARTGNWFVSEENDFVDLQNLLKRRPENLQTLCINANLFGNAGATISQQNGIALAMAYEYIHRLAVENSSAFWFNFAVGGNYFGEIARLRAFRRSWDLLQKELGLKINPAHIYCENSIRNKTIMDAHNNMIRSTSESMAAVIGGCDELSVKPYDITFREDSAFGSRIARNQQNVLQHESHLNAVRDIGAGSFFIEDLTNQLAERSWEFFKEIEVKGGFLQSLKSGWIQKQLKTSADKEQAEFNQADKVLIGANKHSNRDEELADFVKQPMFFGSTQKDTVVEPVEVRRLSQELEKKAL